MFFFFFLPFELLACEYLQFLFLGAPILFGQEVGKPLSASSFWHTRGYNGGAGRGELGLYCATAGGGWGGSEPRPVRYGTGRREAAKEMGLPPHPGTGTHLLSGKGGCLL